MEGVLFSVQGGVSAICSECFCSPVVRMVSDTPIHPHVQSVKTTARSVRSVSGVCRKKIKKKKKTGWDGFYDDLEILYICQKKVASICFNMASWRSFTYASGLRLWKHPGTTIYTLGSVLNHNPTASRSTWLASCQLCWSTRLRQGLVVEQTTAAALAPWRWFRWVSLTV